MKSSSRTPIHVPGLAPGATHLGFFDPHTEEYVLVQAIKGHSGWLAEFYFRRLGTGQARLDAVTIRPDAKTPTTGGVTGRMLRAVSVPDAIQLVAEHASIGGDKPLADWAAAFESERRPGRRGRPDEFYAELAAEYVELVGQGLPPVKTMAHRRSLSVSQVNNLIHEARRRGLLDPPPSPGQAGGVLTPRARKLLNKQEGG